MKLIVIIKIHILLNTCTFPFAHRGISRQPSFKALKKNIKALYHRDTKICSNQQLLDDQMKKVLSFMSCNGFPNYVCKPLMRRLKSNSTITSSKNSIEKNDKSEIIFCLPYAGNPKWRAFEILLKMSLYCNAKDPHGQKNHVIYKIKCLGCNCCYIGKTERCLITRITEHVIKETEPMFKPVS